MTRVKIVCHDCSPQWVSWGYVITWPDGSTDMRMGCATRELAEVLAAKIVREREDVDR